VLNEFRVLATLPALDMERAKRFYTETLGFAIEAESPQGAAFISADGTRLGIFPSPNPNRGGHTQAGWDVQGIETVVADLKARGVVFEEYDLPEFKTVGGIADSPVGQAAWFKDSEGNLLGLIQRPS
jgi:predicted enzyme related to lactoylglutathione lyase